MLRALLLIVALGASVARGDVVTRVSGSRLVVIGDRNPNAVRIEAAPDGVLVLGIDGTLVDGSSEGVTVAGVQRLTVKLKQRADRLTLRSLTGVGRIALRLGKGNDDVVLDDVRAGATQIQTGGGRDAVSVVGRSHLRRLRVDTSIGEDSVWLDGVRISGDLDIDTGSDDDDVLIFVTDVGDDLDVHLGNDEDVLVLASVEVDDDAHLDGEDGDDLLFFDGYVWFDDDLDIDGFDDDDWWWY